MTVSSPVNSVTYTGNNATTVFSYAFEIRVAENAVVILTDITDPSDPIAVTLAAAQYTLTGVGDENGGTVTYPIVGSPITTDQRITIQSIEPFTQEVDLVNQDGFYPSVVEGALDKLTRMCQQLDEQLTRAVLTPVGATQDVDLSELIDAINTAAAALAGAVSVLTPCTATGTNAIALTPVTGGALVSYINQALFSFVAVNTTSGAVTVNISGLGAKKVYLETGVQASTGDIVTGVLYLMSYVAALDGAVGGFYLFGTGTITLARLPSQAEATVLGRAVGAGAGTPVALTATQLQAIQLPLLNRLGRGYQSGCILSNDTTDAVNDFVVSAGQWRDDTNSIDITLPTALIKRSDATFVAGTNQGALDTGVVGNDSYHVFLIMRTDLTAVDVLFSINPTAPTMPANYTWKRLIGSMLRVGGTIIPFLQDGDFFWRGTIVQDIAVTNPGTVAVTSSALSIPTDRKLIAMLDIAGENGSNNFYARVSSLDQADVAPTSTAANYSVLSTGVSRHFTRADVRTDTLARVRYRLSASGVADNFFLYTLGWIDSRGRND